MGRKKLDRVLFSPRLILNVRVRHVEGKETSGTRLFFSGFVSLSTAFFSPHQLVTVQKGIIVDYEAVV